MPKENQSSAIMRNSDKFKISLYVLLSIAAVFIAIIPARLCMGIFSGDKSIFLIALVGNTIVIEAGVWIFLSGPSEIYQSRKGGKKQAELTPMPIVESKTELSAVQGEEAQATENEETPKTDLSAIYDKGCDDYHNKLSAIKKEKLEKIDAYLHYILAPFVKRDSLDTICGEFMSFAIDAQYEPKPWKGFKGILTNFDVRHVTWNIAVRLGLGKGKPYSTEICVDFIKALFPELCEELDYSTLKNLRASSPSEKIHIDEPGQDGISFHIPETE